MNYTEAIIMGILQGFTEWLPISSSGQVMLALINFFGISPEKAHSYALLLHFGTLFAVLFKFRYELGKILMNLITLRWGEEETFLFYSTLFTAVVGFPLYKAFKTAVASLNVESVNGIVGFALILTGIVLARSRENPKDEFEQIVTKKRKGEVTIVEAIIAGIAQGVAILPGISRSGMTIGALLLLGVEQKKAVKLSFLMAVPAIFGALFLELRAVNEPITVSLAAVLSAFIVSLLTLEGMLKLAEKLNFSKFCILFGSIAVIASLMGVLI
ncbi:undecaprenyl-diphosphate phosphatase [Thermococcus paralvinellae]|uniref:Undecaprenyl-diphosphatase n=1 Tax=Thermococcus paralvinellae TaxID=582419 RepID=W0I6T8_9EURY|nr:undecaprenyl-diphosphate phosphatase [Thermococcus paralvinellae]AHF80170.1 undecaprenyl-diphosphatase [Thermococcus paralvinellae]